MLLVLVIILASFVAFPVACEEQTPAQNQTMVFIENVLPVDLSKYNITFITQSTLELGTRTIDTVRYLLDSEESTIKVSCNIQDGGLLYCQVTEKNGSVITDKQYLNLIDAVTTFLERYQTYTKIDSTNLVAMLDEVDITKNSTTTIDNIKLTISTSNWAGKDLTRFRWAHSVNGVDYTSIQVGFRKDGMLDSLYDDRGIYTIGNTSIDISKEEAIEIAMKDLSIYEYLMPDKTMVSNFNITEEYTTAELGSSFGDSTVLRPYWNVKLHLNQTYPGSVRGFTVFIWADSGELYSHSNIAYGGADYDNTSNNGSNASSETDNSLLGGTSVLLDSVFAIGVAVAIIGLATASVIMIKKKRT